MAINHLKLISLLCDLILIWLRLGNSTNSELQKFDITGFELCVFNVLVAPYTDKENFLTVDFVERFVILNQGAPDWSRSSILEPPVWTIRTTWTNSGAFLNLSEICSFNIIINIMGCSTIKADLILGTRLLNPRNMVYLLRSEFTDMCPNIIGSTSPVHSFKQGYSPRRTS